MRSTRAGNASLVASSLLLYLLLAAASPVRASPAGAGGIRVVPTELCNCPAQADGSASGSAPFQVKGPPALGNYDEQVGMTFTQGFTSIEYNVSAIKQTDPLLGTGPAYLVNGLSDTGYWYQVGVSWDWSPGDNPGTGFDMNYEVFDTAGNSVFPLNGQGGLSMFSGPVNPGDMVLLDLYFSNTTQSVVMVAMDTETGATASQNFSNMGATYFVGLPSGVANSNGFFTGLMTEWYHGAPYYTDEATVVYSDTHFELDSAWMWMDEFDASTFSPVFESNSMGPVSFASPTTLQELSYNGTTEYADAFELITGALTNATQSSGVPMVLSFGVKGGGPGYSPPTFTYVSGGKSRSVQLTENPVVYFAEPGSPWSVSAQLPGSTSGQRWQADQPVSGTVGSPTSVAFEYYDQENVTFGYSVSGGGSGYSPPTVTFDSFGAQDVAATGVAVWADAGGRYQYSGPLAGSTATERWFTTAAGSIGASRDVTAVYHHQYLLTFDVAFKDTEVFPSVSLASTSAGSPYSATLVQGTNKVWLDSGSTYAVPQSFSLESGQRLLTNGTAAGTVSSSGTVQLVYARQFYIEISPNLAAGGTVSPLSGWYDSGSTVQLDAAPSADWQFEGWVGTGSDSASGPLPELSLTVGPGSPANETAVFYPGVEVQAMGPSSVSYSDGNVSGTVPGGTTREVYVPPSSTLKLTASVVPFFTEFSGWSGATDSSSGTVSMMVVSPATINSASGYDYAGIVMFAAVLAIIVAGMVIILRRTRSARASSLNGSYGPM
jgi:hypothetical protein